MKTIKKETIYSRITNEYEIETDKGARLRFTMTTAGGTDSDGDDDGCGHEFDGKSQEIYDALDEVEKDAIFDYIMAL
jgi:hypothetical protein